ncbi:hypothetical protein MPD5_0118 [Melissococcus plutonius DAT561]|uniref:Uncharacterized protein n=1 Tax=Melissococcus plutonius TaxID=33970 RepID=A0A2Z5Y0D7_9ENTE|nr:hypothetical protein MPD5_0118 [Melissococcus plutonius DAT561]BBC60285.1 hypothetical protein DAT561_0117 [Melissococcus plutonius]BBD14559.1 hypothetical protein DAT585_0116 [Melissococcus plutonius]BBD16176.1 hypothetical protein DAT606_0116 [Melissococcus plutonius]BBP06730.1 hypothetical protein DAT1033_0116 [Melissococcus plutonius]
MAILISRNQNCFFIGLNEKMKKFFRIKNRRIGFLIDELFLL